MVENKTWHPNKAKHKAMHGGYRKKPTQQEIRATIAFFNCSNVIKHKQEKIVFIQLKLF